MVGQRLVASVAVAAFIPTELCQDHLVATGTLTPGELPARDLGHARLPFNRLPTSHAVTTSGHFPVRWPGRPGEVSGHRAGLPAGPGWVLRDARSLARRAAGPASSHR